MNRRTGLGTRAIGLLLTCLLLLAGFVALATLPSVAASGSDAHTAPRSFPSASDPSIIPVKLEPVRFAATGLPAGTPWSIALDGQVMTTTGTMLTFDQPTSGIPYLFWVPPVLGGAYVPTPPTGNVTVSGAPITETISFALPRSNESAVIFTTASLPRNVSWGLHINGTDWRSANRSLQVWLENGTYNFSLLPVVGFVPSPANGTLTVAGRGILTTVAFSPVPSPRLIAVHQTGLGATATWSLVVNSTAFWGSGPTIWLNASPGIYPYSVPAVSDLVPGPDNGSFTANLTFGSVTNVSVLFGTSSVALYPVGFTETGLPNSTSWSVTLNGQKMEGPGPKAFNESNGTYSYTVPSVGQFRANVSSGSVVVDGRAVNVSVKFTNTTPPNGTGQYTIRFQESGLRAGTNWSVTLGTHTNTSTTSYLSFREPNGSYPYTVAATGYSSTPHSGTVMVNGSASVANPIVVSFTATGGGGGGSTATYLLKFVATGLPAGTNWSVVLAGQHQSSIATSIDFNEPNGSYDYTIGPVAGFSANTTGGSATVHGANVTVLVSFSSTSGGSSPSLISGIPAWGWAVIGLLVVILIVGVLLVMTRRPGP